MSQKQGKNQICTEIWFLVNIGTYARYSYGLVDCDGDHEAYRLCIREPKDCSSGSPSNVGKRKKRELNQQKEPSLDWIFKDERKSKLKLKNEAQKAERIYKENFKKMDLQKSYPALFEILWYTQLPCFDVEGVTSDYNGQYGMLKSCFWKGREMPCSKVFDTFPTDQGMCCTFNMDKAEKMFKDGKYREMVQKMQKRDKHLSFDKKSWSMEKKLVFTSETGISKGLQVILDAHSNLLAGGTVAGDFDGFFGIIDSKDQYPMTSRKSILIKPGQNTLVSMSATKITSDDIGDIDPKLRNCLFPDDKEMVLHNNYSQANCIMECQLFSAFGKVKYKQISKSLFARRTKNFPFKFIFAL